MNNLTLPPEFITESGRVLRVTRAWPLPGGTGLSLEFEDSGQRRAGTWDGSTLHVEPFGADSRLSALAKLAPAGVVVSHRRGKRAVVHHDDVFIKVVRRGRASSILEGIERASAFAENFRTPQVRAHDESTVSFAELAGHSLHDPSLFSAQEWQRAWAASLGAWTRSVRDSGSGSSSPTRPTKEHLAADEIDVLRHWTELVSPFIDAPDSLRDITEEITDELARLPEVALRPAHRDLHDKQLLWSPKEGPGLLDVDTACLADPALDLGNLRAHARLRQLQHIWNPEQARAVVEAVDAAASQLQLSPHTIQVYERSATLRLGCVYAVRPAYTEVATKMRGLAQRGAAR